MLDEDKIETQRTLEKTRKVCGSLSQAVKIVFVIFCLWWLVSSILLAVSIVDPSLLVTIDNVDILGLSVYIIDGIIIAIIFIVIIKMFSDPAKGESPFIMAQVGRLRLISLMLVLYAIMDSLVSYSASSLYFNNSGLSMSDPFLTINFAPIVAAAIVYVFSFVFKYGVLLQEFSDESV